MTAWYFRDGRVVPETATVTVGKAGAGSVTVWDPCWRCGGTGHYPSAMYNGICLECNGGKGKLRTRKCYTAEKLAKLNAAQDKANERKQAAAQVEHQAKAAVLEAHPNVVLLRLHRGLSPFLTQLNEQADARAWLSERQIECIPTVVLQALEHKNEKDAMAERYAAAPAWVAGRQTVTGVVVALKEQEGDYGMQLKMLVELPDGRRCWGTAPTGVGYEWGMTQRQGPEAKLSVTFTATFQPKAQDPHFAYFKRPRRQQEATNAAG